jgi:predicted regulator of Ras-like GTPase activity (Roadblock/LC7/MglB family)
MILGLGWRALLHRIFDDTDFDDRIIAPPLLSYTPQKSIGQVITVAEHDQFSCPVISDHLTSLELPPEPNLSGLVDSDGVPIESVLTTENLATKFVRGDAVVIQPGKHTYPDGGKGTRIQVDHEAVGIVLGKETVELGTKRYRCYRVLVGMEKPLVFEEFMATVAT